jgi:ATP/maltotriose-dependent transcriptional regulator MalT
MASLAHEDAQQIRDERLFLREHELEEADLGYFSRELACEVNAVGALDVGGGVLISCRKPAIDPLNDPLRKLSPREYEVLQYVVNGYSNRAIANEIGTLSSTVSTQKASMLKKTGSCR